MNHHPKRQQSDWTVDVSLLAEAVAEIESAFAAGKEPDFESLDLRFPEHKQELREIALTIGALQEVSAAQESSTDRLINGKVLGDFKLLREIGRGGMGVVYEAEQLSLDRRVALKVLPLASFLDERQLRRFKNEARAAASLKHPNIVSVFGVGSERSVHFYAMELIHGSDLATVVRQIHSSGNEQMERLRTPKSNELEDTSPIAALSTQRFEKRSDFFRSVARLGKQAAQALHFAHQEGVIHRDIKPANLLLDLAGDVHIADFGLAQFGTGEDLTLTGDTVGTLRYMSPEQVIGKQLVDQRTDVYSLGVTLYELVVGKPAFESFTRHDLLRDVVETTPKGLASLVPDVPGDLATIIQCASAKDREDRYQAMEDLAADLGRFLNHRPVLAKPPTLFQRAKKWCVRNQRVALAAAIVLVSLIIGLGVSLSQWRQASVAKDQFATEVYSSNMLLAYEAYHGGDVRNARHHFQQATEAVARHRGEFEWQYMSALLERADNQAAVIPCDHAPTRLGFSPDGKSIYVAHKFGIEKWDAGTLKKVWFHKMRESWRRAFIVSTRRSEVYTAAGSRLRVLDADSGQEKAKVDFELGARRNFRNLLLSSDESQVFLKTNYSTYSVHDTEVYAYEVASGESKRLDFESAAEIENFAVDPTGNFIATSHRDHTVWLRNAHDWSIVRKVGEHRSTVRALSFSQDGRLLISGPGDSSLQGWDTKSRVWDLVEDRELRNWSIQSGEELFVAPNRRAFAIAGSSGGLTVHFSDREESIVLSGHSAPIRLVAWSPDSRSLATVAENTVRLWHLGVPLQRTSHATNVMSLAVLDEDTAFISGESWEHSLDSRVVLEVDLHTEQTKPFSQTAELPTGICIDRVGNRLFCAEYHGKSQFWELGEAKDKKGHLLRMPGTAAEVAVSNSGRVLALGEYQLKPTNTKRASVQIWDVSNSPATLMAAYETDHHPTALDFSPDDRLLAISDWNGHMTVFDTVSHRLVFSHRMAENKSYDASFSKCGKYLAATDSARRVWVWRTRDWKAIGSPFPHKGDIRCLGFSPNSNRLVTAGVDRIVSIWDVNTQRLVARIQLDGASVSAIGFTPSGKKLICCHADMTVSVLNTAQNKSNLTMD